MGCATVWVCGRDLQDVLAEPPLVVWAMVLTKVLSDYCCNGLMTTLVTVLAGVELKRVGWAFGAEGAIPLYAQCKYQLLSPGHIDF